MSCVVQSLVPPLTLLVCDVVTTIGPVRFGPRERDALQIVSEVVILIV